MKVILGLFFTGSVILGVTHVAIVAVGLAIFGQYGNGVI